MSGGRILSLYINNKSGGLIYQRNFSPRAAELRDNDQMMVSSTFNSITLILQELCPTKGSRPMRVLEASAFTLATHDTLTGLKLFMLAEPGTQGLDLLLRHIFGLYCDYVLKNPFYELDMPIHCEKFDERLTKLIADFQR
mmetsp:Transcript_6352/g.16237  ORF Transcript_6352/g.16237 Transcript_6352/m.16237 type:complete len:140 (+) Transcript_6352:110-529(+)|eukprot:CAMPEP_0119422724 /NCGR_PEP_ID=MMETSP1335-20130426/28812_1 /TAXON_ID=259385 /ORGANISM="Chrysoculter rhomboideus, Strain RCC1486" /LENGTH=139 /DNA_ID=CAMNT_0007448185 /DNA_START=53 /DNA_END=472 /DNA_ORIENTATION=-